MGIDATVAGAGSDSYLTVAAADTLAAADMGPDTDRWVAAKTTVEDREQALKRATREIDDYTRTSYAPFAATQKLRYPRADVDVVSSAAVIPTGIAHATYYLAAFMLRNSSVIARRDARKARGQRQYSEEGTSGSESDDVGPDWPDRVMRALSGFAVAGRMSERGIGSLRLSGGFVGGS